MEELLVIIGAAFVVSSAVGALVPNTRVGRFCRRFAADLRGVARGK